MFNIRHDEGLAASSRTLTSVLVTRRVTFAAAHALRRADWDEERNRAAFGKCVADHGHNYVLEVSVSGEPDPDTGMVIDLKDLDLAVRDGIVRHVDHRHLNHDVPFLQGIVPTAENLALAFWSQFEACLRQRSPDCRLQRLRLIETENNMVEVSR
jgi:6-pyruvoyltetrahydropterin/6-carboxytetrahydropterin synthase